MSYLAHVDKQMEGAEIVRGAEECYRQSLVMLEELGFPKGVLPLRNLEECGWVRETGFVWMKQKEPYEHFFTATKTKVRYEAEVTAYVEKKKMKKMTGVKSKQAILWVPIVEMSSFGGDGGEVAPPASGEKIYFKSAVGIGRSFPASAFVGDGEEGEKKQLNA